MSFMQRERGQRRESLSDDETALYAFEARRVLEISQALRAGQVRLKQEIWHNGVITLCQGGTATPDFDARAAGWLAGALLVANKNFCRWQPNEFGGRQAMGDQIGSHAQHNRLGFRIAEAAVKLNNFRLAIRAYHQAGIQETGIDILLRRHPFHRWPNHLLHHPAMDLIGHDRSR